MQAVTPFHDSQHVQIDLFGVIDMLLIGVDGRGISIGYFATRAQAVDARRAAELHYFGELCPVPNA